MCMDVYECNFTCDCWMANEKQKHVYPYVGALSRLYLLYCCLVPAGGNRPNLRADEQLQCRGCQQLSTSKFGAPSLKQLHACPNLCPIFFVGVFLGLCQRVLHTLALSRVLCIPSSLSRWVFIVSSFSRCLKNEPEHRAMLNGGTLVQARWGGIQARGPLGDHKHVLTLPSVGECALLRGFIPRPSGLAWDLRRPGGRFLWRRKRFDSLATLVLCDPPGVCVVHDGATIPFDGRTRHHLVVGQSPTRRQRGKSTETIAHDTHKAKRFTTTRERNGTTLSHIAENKSQQDQSESSSQKILSSELFRAWGLEELGLDGYPTSSKDRDLPRFSDSRLTATDQNEEELTIHWEITQVYHCMRTAATFLGVVSSSKCVRHSIELLARIDNQGSFL